MTSRNNERRSSGDAEHFNANESAGITQAVFHGSGIQHSGHGHFNVQGNVNITSNPPPDSKEVEECMEALFLTDPSEDRDMLKRKKGARASGTCEWILETEELTAWLYPEKTEQKSQPNNVLWLYGNPGTGKSTTAIFLTEDLSDRFSEVGNKTLTYFFCDASFEKRKTATSIIRGLLFQLAQKHKHVLKNHILPKYKERRDKLFTSFDALWKIFIAAAADQATGHTYCIIDALDECDNDSQETLLYQLQETFMCQEKTPSNVSVLITCRPYPEIREYLQDFRNKDLATFYQTRQDIDRCINERVDDLAKKKHYTDKVKGEIIIILRDKAECTFLWIGLACEELRRKPSKDAIHFLQKMPKGLASLYKNLLQAVFEDQNSEEDTIRRILGFVAVSLEVLSVLQLSEACQLYQDETDLDTRLQYTRDQIAACRLLVVIQDEKVQLLHQSARDFLVGTGQDSFIDRLETHASFASRCIGIVIESLDNEQLCRHPFFTYGINNWPDHVREAREKFKISESQIAFFTVNSPAWHRWFDSFAEPSGFSLVHAAARWGLATLMEYALGLRKMQSITGESLSGGTLDVNRPDGWGRSPLELALLWGEIEIVDMLLKAGANLTKQDVRDAISDFNCGTALVLSLLDNLVFGETFIHCILLDVVGRVPFETKLLSSILIKYEGKVQISREVLKTAARSQAAMEIMPLLLDQAGGQTITEDLLIEAARNEDQGENIVKLLLKDRGYRIPITEDVIIAAIHNNQQRERIVEILSQYQGREIIVTEKLAAAAAAAINNEQGREVFELLLQHQRGEATITEDMMINVMSNKQGRYMLKLFLKLHKGNITIIQPMVLAAMRNKRSKEFFQLLLQSKSNRIKITEVIVIFAMGYKEGREILRLLLQLRESKITITERAVMAAMRTKQGEEVLKLLSQFQESKIIFTEEMIMAVMEYKRGKEIMGILLQCPRDNITITENMVIAAIGIERCRDILESLLQLRESIPPITERILLSIIKHRNDRNILELLHQYQEDQPTFATTRRLISVARRYREIATTTTIFIFRNLVKTITSTEDIKVDATDTTRMVDSLEDFLDRELAAMLLSESE